uniref:eukaryotic translation initiation factor 5 n=1 Tax=Myxine glutinosa TaxID=7769 RepID=UPI00358E348E
MSLNINRTVSDQFYRYKMPRLIAKVEGKGNGIKTVVVNMTDIAKSLNRPPTYPTKYFGCELGAQTQFDVKNDRFIVNGAHESNRLQDMLDGFIKKFVLCPECENPETVLHINARKQIISQTCKACGFRGILDTKHKLCTFILKNPPESAETPTTKKDKDKKPGKERNGSVASSAAENAAQRANGGDIDAPEAVHDGKEEDDWCEETTEEACRRRMGEMSEHARNLTLTDDLERPLEERVDLFYNFVKRKCDAGTLDQADKDLFAEAERLEVRNMGPLILSELLLDGNVRDQLKKYRRHFHRFCHGNSKAQKYMLGGFECVVKMHKEQLLPRVPHLLKDMYDADLLDEESILGWAEKVSKKYVSKELAKEIRIKATPFVNWLKEAEEESEDDGDEDEEGEEEADDEEDNGGEVYYEKRNKLMETVSAKGDEDDLDIDAI